MSDSRSLEESYLIHKADVDEIVESFDCGDDDLNGFIKNSAADFREQLLAVTYVLVSRENPNKIIGYCSLANDTVDAYVDAIPFYEKNGFHLLDEGEVKKSDVTRIMYFDLKRIQ